MGSVILSLAVSVLLGCIAWVVFGAKLKLNEDKTVNEALNLVTYIGMLILPIFAIVFAVS